LSFLLLTFFSSTKLEIRAEHILPESEGGWGERAGMGGSIAGRNNPNNMHTLNNVHMWIKE
jgi:hypothetical protein